MNQINRIVACTGKWFVIPFCVQSTKAGEGGGPSSGARARCLLFCVQSPGPAGAGGHPQGCRLADPTSSAAARADRCQLFVYVGPPSRTHTIGNYLCVRRDVHTHNWQLFMYVGPSTARSSWSIPPPPAVRAPGRQGWGAVPRGSGQLFVWVGPSSRTHTIANYLCVRRDVQTQLPIVYVRGTLRGPIPCSVANYLCRSGRLHVHTQLPIVYVRGPSLGPTSI